MLKVENSKRPSLPGVFTRPVVPNRMNIDLFCGFSRPINRPNPYRRRPKGGEKLKLRKQKAENRRCQPPNPFSLSALLAFQPACPEGGLRL